MHRKGNHLYDEDDLDYEDDDDYYDDGLGDYDEPPPAPKLQRNAPKKSQPASALGAALSAQPKQTKATQKAASARASPFPAAPQGTAFNFSTPSPDDAVSGARRNAAPSAPATSTAAKEVADVPQGPRLPHRDFSEYKPDSNLLRDVTSPSQPGASHKGRLHLAVLGHVDAGKSTLVGRILHASGEISVQQISRMAGLPNRAELRTQVAKAAREAEKLGKSSFGWAFLLDERQDERERGITADVGSAVFQTPHRMVTVLDAPGHRDFVPKMIVGAGMADAALLLVDGSRGGFEAGFKAPQPGFAMGPEAAGGQTREHVLLASSLGIAHLIVVVSKLDTLGSPHAAKERYDEVLVALRPFLEESGFPAAQTRFLPAVAVDGANVGDAPAEGHAIGWWDGLTVLGAIDEAPVVELPVGAPLRVVVGEVGRKRGLGTALGGRVECGAVRQGDRVVVMPEGIVHVVKGLESHGRSVEVACAGQSVDVGIGDVDAQTVHKGSVVCAEGFPCHVARRLVCEVVVSDIPMPLIAGHEGVLHIHTDMEECTLERLVCVKDPHTGAVTKERPRALLKGQCAVVEVVTRRGVCCELFKDAPALGRVAIRDAGRTLMVGVVQGVGDVE